MAGTPTLWSASILSEIAILLMLVLANGVLAGAELAIISLRKTRVRELVESGSRSARAVSGLRENPDRFLATVQIGITVVSATAGAFGGASMAQPLAGALQGLGVPAQTSAKLSLALVIGLISYLSLVLGELVPKSLALRYSERYALVIGRPLRLLSRLARPLVWLLTASSNLVLRFFKDRTSFSEGRITPEEVQQTVEDASRCGALHPRSGDIASRALELADLSVADVMVPRPKVVGLRRHAPLEEWKQVLQQRGHSRLPVYEDTVDRVVGYVVGTELLSIVLEQGTVNLEDALRPAYFIPETTRALDALQQMQVRRTPMALVVDERGGLAGLVTLEDLLEELVGEIFSENDVPPDTLHPEPDGTILADATLSVREVNRALELELPEGEAFSTLGGLCMAMAGVIPAPGTLLTTDDGTELEVVEASARRVKQVRIRPPARPPEEADPEAQHPPV
ncbi:putative hemolysin [Archangium gephyra]|uniref:Hemolysin n=2 Tax=Archangium gephyra TaxID=48 RepID=A0AAC8QFV3_9BACT|nr:Magnesium and cobalt efflux protein CorC [Archangium gephyra]REG32010.1 putative hemolysin [Archangium gephyra]